MPFSNIVGQNTAVKYLKLIIRQKQARGSYLFLGPDGVGKRTTAVEFAKTINCETQGCDSMCVSCKKVDSGNHPDVFLVSPEGASYSIKIDKVRDIIYQASLKPYEGAKRVFIIEDAEEMLVEAQNALLKLLEEPPQNHIIILTASNISGLLPTVVSRCKILRFNSIARADIEDFLENRHGIERKETTLLSHMAMGSIGMAIDFKEKDFRARREKVINDFFLRMSALFRETVLNEEVAGDLEGSLSILLCWHRDLLVAKFTDTRDAVLNIDKYEEILAYSRRFSVDKLEQDILLIMKTIEYVRKNINPKIALFNMAVRLQPRLCVGEG